MCFLEQAYFVRRLRPIATDVEQQWRNLANVKIFNKRSVSRSRHDIHCSWNHESSSQWQGPSGATDPKYFVASGGSITAKAKESVKTLVQAFVSCRLDYCIALLMPHQ